jgi:hypothetical protein
MRVAHGKLFALVRWALDVLPESLDTSPFKEELDGPALMLAGRAID